MALTTRRPPHAATTESGQSASPADAVGIVASPRVAVAGVITASVSMGLVPIFARTLTDDGMAPVAVSFYRNLLGAVLLGGMLRLTGPKRTATLWGLFTGIGMGFGWTTYVEAVTVVPVSTAGVIYLSYPIFTLLVLWAVFGQPPTRRALVGAVVVVVAAVIALGPEVSGEHTSELLILLAAPISFGLAVAVLTERMGSLNPLERVATVGVGSSAGLAPLVLSLPGDEVIPAEPSSWLLIIGIGLLTGVGPQWLYVKCAPRVGAPKAAVTGAIELPTMFAVSVLVFGEGLTITQVLAGLLVVGAILAVPSRPSPATVMARRRRRLIPGRFDRA